MHRRTTMLLGTAVFLAAIPVAGCEAQTAVPTNPTASSAGARPGGGGGHMGGGHMGGGHMGGGEMGMAVSSEFEYLVQMIPHHEEAIVAATLLQQGSDRAEMRALAASIIETQTAEVAQMKAWLGLWYAGRDTHVDYEPMMRDLTGVSGSALDREFLEDMIPHHMMAVMMSQRLVMAGLAEHGEVVPFASSIRDNQHREIGLMAGWMQEWFGTSMGHGGGMSH